METGTPERLLQEHYMSPNSSFRLFRQTVDGPIGTHWHDFFEISLIESGRGTHVLNGRKMPLRPRSLFLLTPADFHEIVPDPGEEFGLYNAIFDQPFIRAELLQWLYRSGGGLAVELDEEGYAVAEAEFRRMRAETERPGEGGEWIVAGALERVLVDLLREISRGSEEKGDSRDFRFHPAIREAVVYMQYHFREPLTLEGTARHAGLSANYFSECFRKQVGIPFQAYLQDLRLKFARSLLGTTSIPVTEICYASGFGNLSHFERTFKQKFGRTPRQSRG
mgnify:CR=1 FL=1